MKLFSAFWTQDPAFLFCTVFCTLGRWLSSQFFMSFNPWQCPKEKCSDLQSLFHPLEIPTGCVFPKSAKVTGVQILGFLWGVHFAWLNRVHQPPLLSLDPPIYLLLSMGEGRVGGNGRYAPHSSQVPHPCVWGEGALSLLCFSAWRFLLDFPVTKISMFPPLLLINNFLTDNFRVLISSALRTPSCSLRLHFSLIQI